ncbi:2853_t:CDS:2 [Scutellospora calospora]|uniref:2853_t:CDS:1 n=1 Tax=Scutellospora calospora TaxID=85575 RepID=A0ACA9JU60_9GLOM|nr:2853_t:CDS:2 [Scutellospora calospora]
MTAKLGTKYSKFHVDLIKCLNHYIDQNEFKELWNNIMVNDNYSRAKSYLEVLNHWREQWVLAYLKDYFFANISSTQRRESMNKLLKGFLDTFDVCEEAEHLSLYKELDVYTCEEITSDDELCCFKLSCYEKPDAICWVCYDGCKFACSYRNFEFARIVCRYSLAVALELAKDYINFYSCSQFQELGTQTLHESSSKGAAHFQYMCIHRLLGEIVSRIATDSTKYVDFMSYLKKYLETLYDTTNDLNLTYML